MDKKVPQLEWLNPMKAFALLAILLNHLVEEFGPGPWFTNPSSAWPDFNTRISTIFPDQYAFPISLIQFLGWLGDSGPGVFILASGFGLAWSSLHRKQGDISIGAFYKRRLLRLFPLYITMHFIILLGAVFIPSNHLTFASPRTLLSLLGLRFTDGLFFYINPSWWFIWLIIQLYLVYPILFCSMQNLGLKGFFILTAVFTFASRLLGIMGLYWSGNLYFWMTGIFFGTRLVEFACGMIFAAIIFKWKDEDKKLPATKSLLVYSLGFYFLGLFASFTWPGTLVSNLFVTLGLSGIFYSAWEIIIKKQAYLKKLFIWIGLESFGVYLLHQTPLKWTANFFQSNTMTHLFAASTVLALSFPIGWAINRAISKGLQYITTKAYAEKLNMIVLGICIITVAAILFVEPSLSGRKYRLFAICLGLSFAGVSLYEIFVFNAVDNSLAKLLRWSVLPAAFMQLFVMPSGYGVYSVVFGFCFGSISLIINHIWLPKPVAWITSLIIVLSISAGFEFVLRRAAPLEAGQWGEIPALQVHPTRTYSLKPNQTTRLRYNNYDYVLQTNSIGLASPELELNVPAGDALRILIIGDAFSMPEGVAYEQAYPALLQEILSNQLDDGREVQVINAGVTGYGPAEQYPQLKELAPIIKPDVVVYQFFINEFEEASITRIDRLKNIGLFRNESSVRECFLGRLKRSQLLAHLKKAQIDLKEIIRGKPAKWRYWKSLLYFYRTDQDYYTSQRKQKVRAYIDKMNSVCRGLNALMIVYFVPGSVAVTEPSYISYFPKGENLQNSLRYDLNKPLNYLKEITEELKIPVVDLTPYLKNHPQQPVYFPDSWHWNREGHRVVAKAIAQDIISRGVIIE